MYLSELQVSHFFIVMEIDFWSNDSCLQLTDIQTGEKNLIEITMPRDKNYWVKYTILLVYFIFDYFPTWNIQHIQKFSTLIFIVIFLHAP